MTEDEFREAMRRARYGVDHTPGLRAARQIASPSRALADFIEQWALSVEDPQPIDSRIWKSRSAIEARMWGALTESDRARFDAAYKRGMGRQ